MSRPLLLAMCVGLLVATADTLHCYQCSDNVARTLGSVLAGTAAGTPALSCAHFDLTRADRFRKFAAACPRETDAACGKLVKEGRVTRMCSNVALSECHVRQGVTACFCTGGLCNAAGLMSPALLLLAAALLAALLKA